MSVGAALDEASDVEKDMVAEERLEEERELLDLAKDLESCAVAELGGGEDESKHHVDEGAGDDEGIEGHVDKLSDGVPDTGDVHVAGAAVAVAAAGVAGGGAGDGKPDHDVVYIFPNGAKVT